jgi:hypothetical protein
MSLQGIYSLLALLTISSVVATPSIGKADSLNCRNLNTNCEQTISRLYRSNYIELVKGDGPEVFAIHNGERRWITDSKTFSNYGFRYSEVKQLFDSEITRYPEGQPISANGTLLKGSGPDVYIVINGTRRLVSPKVFSKYQFRNKDINLVNDSNLLSIPEGPAFH